MRVAASWAVALVLALGAVAGCAEPQGEKPREEPRLPSALEAEIASGSTAGIHSDILSTPTGELFGPAPGMPELSGITGRDYSYEETAGPLKGYVTKFYRIKHVLGTTLLGVLNNWKSAQGRIIDLPLQNMLIITEQKENLESLERVLYQIDRVPSQVEIEAKIIEIRRSTNFEFGFELHVNRAPAANSAFRKFDGTFNSPSFLDSLRSGALPFQGAAVDWAAVGKAQQILGDFDYVIRALEQDGYAELLSSPRIVVQSGKKAILTAKTQEPIFTTNIVNTTLQQITTTFQPVGVTLEVTPLVVGTEAIHVDVKPSVSSVIEEIINPTGGLPIPHIAERTVDTQVDVRNGELLVLGGLYQKSVTKNHTKIPVVGSIPLIGRLFQSIEEGEIKTDIIFVLKLRILSNVAKADERLQGIIGSGSEGGR